MRFSSVLGLIVASQLTLAAPAGEIEWPPPTNPTDYFKWCVALNKNTRAGVLICHRQAKLLFPNQPYEVPEGTPVVTSKDYFQHCINTIHPDYGPFSDFPNARAYCRHLTQSMFPEDPISDADAEHIQPTTLSFSLESGPSMKTRLFSTFDELKKQAGHTWSSMFRGRVRDGRDGAIPAPGSLRRLPLRKAF